MRFNVKTVGCHPHWLCEYVLTSKPWVATHTGLKGGLSPPPLRIPGSFTARCRSRAIFQRLRLLPQTPPLRGPLISGSDPLGKNTLAVSHRSFDVVLSAAKGYVNRIIFSSPRSGKRKAKPNTSFDFKNASGRAQKSRRRERWKTARQFARVVTRPEGNAKRRDFAAITQAAET